MEQKKKIEYYIKEFDYFDTDEKIIKDEHRNLCELVNEFNLFNKYNISYNLDNPEINRCNIL